MLATSIAETSLTIEGVRIVVDSGLARVPRYEPDIGLTRLETVRASRAAVDQRRGRAGRTEPGVCYRLWDEPQTASLAAYTQPEILSADLSSLVLDLAQWGVSDPCTLAFLDPPPAPALKEARGLLRELGALDGDGRITDEGQSLRALALPPRLARMIVDSHRLGAGGAGRRDRGGAYRARARRRQRRSRCPARSIPPRPLAARRGSARSLAQRWAAQVAAGAKANRARWRISCRSTGVMLAFAFPDRVAHNRGNGSFVLANGRGAAVEQTAALARAPYIAVAELTGTAAQGRILLAAPITQAEIEAHFADQIETADEISFDRGAMALRARRKQTLHAITLSEAPMALSPRRKPRGYWPTVWSPPASTNCRGRNRSKQWRDRVMFLRTAEGELAWPDLSDDALAARREDWLAPALHDKTSLKDFSAGDLSEALMTLLPWELRARLEREAPTHFEAPTGTSLRSTTRPSRGRPSRSACRNCSG